MTNRVWGAAGPWVLFMPVDESEVARTFPRACARL